MRTSALLHNFWMILSPSEDFKFKARDFFPLPCLSRGGEPAYKKKL